MVLDNNTTPETLISIINEAMDEVFIWDKDMRCVYANDICHRHIGVGAGELIGKTATELSGKEKLWSPTCVGETFKHKKAFIQRQKTILGIDITTLSVPVMDENGNVEYVVQTARQDEDELFRMISPVINKNSVCDKPMQGVNIIYKSEIMKDTIRLADKVSQTDATVLILGETGTGKNLLARYIHENSRRKDERFVSINLSALSPSVIESELFGYEEGAFTGARSGGRKGLFEEANGGTIFLDEIGDMPCDLQVKLLHTLQEGFIIPVGSSTPVDLDIRVICATNNNLPDMIKAGKFREDLYHRINVFDLMIPPLRNRKSDIEPLVAYYLNLFNAKYSRYVNVSRKAMNMLLKYPWRGNVRELSNVIERGVLTAENNSIEITDLPASFFSYDNVEPATSKADFSLESALKEYEKRIVKEYYALSGSSRKLADMLKVSQTKANKLIQKHINTK